jgi:hypothetical protein
LSFIIYFNFLFIELFYSHYLSHSVFQINLDWLELIFFFKFDFSFNLIFWYWVDWELNIIICFDLFSFELSWSYDQICGFIRLIWVDSICYYLNIFLKQNILNFWRVKLSFLRLFILSLNSSSWLDYIKSTFTQFVLLEKYL